MLAHSQPMTRVEEIPWRRSGVRLENPATAAEAITAAGLDWEVQKQPLFTGPERQVRVRDRYAVCRTDRLGEADGGQLGVVGRDYQPLQNREAFAFLDPVVGEGAAVYHTVGSLRGGRQLWLLAKLPGEIVVAGNDVTEKYLLLSNSHDGSTAVRIGFTPIRVVCQNTLNLALRGMGGLAIRHHADVLARVRDAHRVLAIAADAYGRIGETMRAMAGVPMTGGRLEAYLDGLLPLPEDERLRAGAEQRRGRLAELFETGEGNALPGVRGTLWAAYNAVTQWVDRESYTRRQKEPLRTIWFGPGAALKGRAYTLAETLAASLN